MSIRDDEKRRANALLAVENAVVALNTAGMCLLRGREHYPAEGQELATALRDDITTMVGDAAALKAVIAGR